MMKRYYIETYDDYDWTYHVFADSEEEAVAKLQAYFDEEEIEQTIHKVHGPYIMKSVLPAKQPNL